MIGTRCDRDEHGREVGIITHNGHEFRALGASTSGPYLNAYLHEKRNGINLPSAVLQTWCGRRILEARSEMCGDYWTDDNGKSFGLIFRLTNRRAIVGYALGAGMLFRGELVESREWDTEDELRGHCRRVCEHWIERDAEDAEEFRREQEAEDAEEAEAWAARG